MATPFQSKRVIGAITLLLAGTLSTISLVGCDRATGSTQTSEKAAAERIMVVGASTIAPLMSEIAKAYEQSHPGVRIEVQAGGSSRGVLDVRQGTAGIGMVSRELKSDEADLKHVMIAQDGVGMIVHKNNPIQHFTKQQVIDIYSGKITNWKQLGGNDAPITVVSKAEGRSTLEIFSHFFGVKYKDIKAHVVIGDNQQGIQAVAGSPAAVGYVSIGTAEYEAQHGAAIKLVSVDNQVPTTAAVAAGEYAIRRPLNLVFKEPLTATAKELVQFAQSQDASELVKKQFFVPVTK